MTTQTVSSVSALYTALSKAHAGDTILLAPGTYTNVSINAINMTGNVTIASASATSQAVIDGLKVANSSGLTFSNVGLSTVGQTNFGLNVLKSSNIAFTNVNATGSSSDLASTNNGLLIQNSSYVSVKNSQFSNFATAIAETNNNYVTITGNNIHHIGVDGIDNAGTSNVNISNNTFTDFEPINPTTMHPDAIQFWTTNTTTSAQNITISGNTITGVGANQMQGIFITDQVGTLPYKNVSITNNTLVGTAWNGIEVMHGQGVTVSGNSLTAGTVTNTWIEMANVSGLSLVGNDSSGYVLTGVTGMTQSNNKISGVLQTSVMTSSVSASVGMFTHELDLTGTAAITGKTTYAGTKVVANNAGDFLYGYADNVTLVGGKGNDYVYSSGGSQTLTGGGGSDHFYITTGINHDVITDLASSTEHGEIDVRQFITAGNHAIVTASGSNTVISFDHSTATVTLIGIAPSHLTTTTTAGLFFT